MYIIFNPRQIKLTFKKQIKMKLEYYLHWASTCWIYLCYNFTFAQNQVCLGRNFNALAIVHKVLLSKNKHYYFLQGEILFNLYKHGHCEMPERIRSGGKIYAKTFFQSIYFNGFDNPPLPFRAPPTYQSFIYSSNWKHLNFKCCPVRLIKQARRFIKRSFK